MTESQEDYNLKRSMVQAGEFVEKHDLTVMGQMFQLVSEVGELADALLRSNNEDIREEMGDVMFVLITIDLMVKPSMIEGLCEVAMENSKKNAEKEGSKVTKE